MSSDWMGDRWGVGGESFRYGFDRRLDPASAALNPIEFRLGQARNHSVDRSILEEAGTKRTSCLMGRANNRFSKAESRSRHRLQLTHPRLHNLLVLFSFFGSSSSSSSCYKIQSGLGLHVNHHPVLLVDPTTTPPLHGLLRAPREADARVPQRIELRRQQPRVAIEVEGLCVNEYL